LAGRESEDGAPRLQRGGLGPVWVHWEEKDIGGRGSRRKSSEKDDRSLQFYEVSSGRRRGKKAEKAFLQTEDLEKRGREKLKF